MSTSVAQPGPSSTMASKAPPTTPTCTLGALPDELLLRVLSFLDIPELLSTSRTSHHLRLLSLDPHLHRDRLRHAYHHLHYLLPRRPRLTILQPPQSTIYLTRMHLAARRLHWSLVSRRLNRSLRRRPAALAALVSANILPRACCKVDRRSGELVRGSDGAIVERMRKVEREQIKEGLKVWLERKADQIRARRDASVGVLVWRFSRRASEGDGSGGMEREKMPLKEKVNGLTRFFEGLSSGRMSV